MNNLFSIFDPSNGIVNINWVSSSIVLLLPTGSFWVSSNPFKFILKNVFINLKNEFNMALSLKLNNGMSFLLISFFTFILWNNFLGLLPYVFTSTSQLSMTFSLSLPLWAGFMIYSSFFNISLFLAHLVPLGTPNLLIPFMVFIELISNFMRPLTLAVRLTANMIAGHLLLALVSSPMATLPMLMLVVAFSSLVVLMVLEVAVSMIQAYVFSTLSSLYLAEVSYPNL